MQRRIIANRVTGAAIAERWTGGRWVLEERGGPTDLCSIDHHEIKADLDRFRRCDFAGYQDAGAGARLELRFCPAAACRSTIAIWVDADGNPCEGPQ